MAYYSARKELQGQQVDKLVDKQPHNMPEDHTTSA